MPTRQADYGTGDLNICLRSIKYAALFIALLIELQDNPLFKMWEVDTET